MQICPISTDAERETCAHIMATSAPWTVLGYQYADLLKRFYDADREFYVLKDGDIVAGFVILYMRGILSGYLQSIGVSEAYRSQGCGQRLMQFVEARVFKDSPNVFLFVSSFNTRAQKFYESLGYERVGLVKDFLVKGYDEHLMRKSIGPLKPSDTTMYR